MHLSTSWHSSMNSEGLKLISVPCCRIQLNRKLLHSNLVIGKFSTDQEVQVALTLPHNLYSLSRKVRFFQLNLVQVIKK
jgi:hypothetical protein